MERITFFTYPLSLPPADDHKKALDGLQFYCVGRRDLALAAMWARTKPFARSSSQALCLSQRCHVSTERLDAAIGFALTSVGFDR